MRWTPGGVSGDIEDRRDQGGGPIRGSHLGLGGTILLLLLSLIFKRDLVSLFSGASRAWPGRQSGIAQRCRGPGGSQPRAICILRA